MGSCCTHLWQWDVVTSEGLTLSVPYRLDLRDERNSLIIRKRANNHLKELLCPEARSGCACHPHVCLCGGFLITFTQGDAIICLCDQLRCLPVLLSVPWAGPMAPGNEESLFPTDTLCTFEGCLGSFTQSSL